MRGQSADRTLRFWYCHENITKEREQGHDFITDLFVIKFNEYEEMRGSQ